MSLLDRIDTICLTVADVEKASKWYQDVLKFTESFKGDTYRILRIGDSNVPLTIEEGNVKVSERQVYPIFYTKNITETYKQLKGKGVNISDLQKDSENTYFDLFDLDGNRLQVCYWE